MELESLKSIGWLLLWGAAFFAMMRFGCGAHRAGGHGHHGSHGGHDRSETGAGRVRDPVCGMEVDPRTAVSFMHRGASYYFCSASCRERFAKAPDEYAGSPMHGGHHHG
jgi:YHS domain-containing protein